jgi:hypothetical protein
MSHSALTRPLLERPLWVRVDSDLTVGNRGGDFLGTIERTTVGFVALDGRGDPAGLFPTRKRAQQALTSLSGASLVRRRARARRAGFAAATGAGSVALALALTAGALAPVL